MRIIASQVEAQSQHQFSRHEARVQVGVQRSNTGNAQARVSERPVPAGLPAAPALPNPSKDAATVGDSSEEGDGLASDVSLLKALVEALIGKRINTASNPQTSAPASSAPVSAAPAAQAVVPAVVTAVSISESESLSVSFAANLTTADGNSISLSLSYTQQRSFQFQSISVAAPTKASDPLLLNFDGSGARLDRSNFQFDLNSDGQPEQLAALAPGSSWLALDRNSNGKIDGGAELFGPATGNGFGELAQYDGDANGFIDSGDAVFNTLQLFRPGEALKTLAQQGVGAIFLGAVDSPFRMTDGADQTRAQLRATSFYVANNGGSGLVQQLDLSV